jgi:hypothetical protein
VSKTVVVKIQRQPTRIEVIQPFNVVIPNTRVEIVVTPNINFVRGGILIGFIANLGRGSNGLR